jgi:Na+-transporting NADH:ubiquinone oxidoreductase subunit C
MMQNKDSISNTFQVAGVLCLVCALLVSATALGLRDLQKTNVALDKKKNILQVAGYSPEAVEKLSSAEIDAIFDSSRCSSNRSSGEGGFDRWIFS